ncbi:TetR/AcrR family transcriptional regulator [Sphingobium sp. CR28]|uniref:TetR/AcrR family transcriptional regulator n=1 Tax=Sphingobium sp. CR28 TaxID=3400272 RepID=UPI003FEDF845
MKLGKREAQKLARRAQIIAVARDQFFEHGYDGTSMSAIAAALGGSKGTLWSYFPSKEQLLVAVIDETAAAFRSAVDTGTQGAPVDALTRLCRSVIEKVTSPIIHQMQRLMAPVVHNNPELARIFYEHGPGRTQTMISEHLRAHFGHLLWTDDYLEAGRDLVMLAAAHYHFEKLWGIGKPITNQDKDARARRAAIMFLRAHAKDPDALLEGVTGAGPSSA